jgi:hypothetical protein
VLTARERRHADGVERMADGICATSPVDRAHVGHRRAVDADLNRGRRSGLAGGEGTVSLDEHAVSARKRQFGPEQGGPFADNAVA